MLLCGVFLAILVDFLCSSRNIVNYPGYLNKYSNKAKIIRFSSKIIHYPNEHH
jgi:hypothetical protein